MNTARPLRPLPRATPRRQEHRIAARFNVKLCSARTKDVLLTWDISFRGVYLETPMPLALRHLVRLAILAAHDGPRPRRSRDGRLRR